MSYHIYENHPENNRPISILVDDDMVIAKYEDDDDVFLMATSEDTEDLFVEVMNELGEELARRVFV